jgi:hypothetical protein
MRAGWTERHEVEGVPCRAYYQRTDGAYVWWSRDMYYSNPENPRCRMWQAFLSDGTRDGRYLRKAPIKRERGTPRKWSTADAAMRAVDREHPIVSAP